MKIADSIKLGVYNCFKKPVASAITAFSFILIFTLVFMSLYYINYTNMKINEVLNNQISLSYVSYVPNSDTDINESIKTINKMGLHGDIKVLSDLWQDNILSQLHHGDISSLEISNYKLAVDGEIYTGNNDNSYTFAIDEKNATAEDLHYADRTVYFGLKIMVKDESIATENEVTEFQNKYPNDEIVLYGREMENDNDVMISDYMLEKFGIKKSNFSNLIGKTITLFYYDNDKNTILIKDSILCGILSQNFFRVESERFSSQFIINTDNTSLASIKDFDLKIQADVSTFKEIKNYADKLTGLNSGDVFYAEQTVKIYSELEVEKEIMSFILSLVVLVIAIAFIINIYYMQYRQIQRKKYFFGLLGAIGMSRAYILILMFAELCFISILSAIMSIIISCILLYAIAAYAEDILGSVLLDNPVQMSILATVVLFMALIISYVITHYNENKLNKEHLIALLNKSETN